MKTNRKNASKSEAELLAQATNNLLKALKGEMIAKQGKVDNAVKVSIVAAAKKGAR